MKASIFRPTVVLSVALACYLVSTAVTAQADPASPSTADELSTIQHRIDTTVADNQKLKKLIEGSEGAVRTMLERRLEERQLRVVDDINTLGSKIAAREAAGEDLSKMHQVMSTYLQQLMPAIKRHVERESSELVSLVSAPPTESQQEAMSRVLSIGRAMSMLINSYAAYDRSIEHLSAFGIDATAQRAYLTDKLHELAELLADIVNLTSEEIRDTNYLLSLLPDDADLKTKLKLLEFRRQIAVKELSNVADLLEKQNVDASGYKSLVLQVSGDVSSGLLETGVWAKLVRQWGQNAWEWAGDNSLNWILKLLVLAVILYVAKVLSNVTRRIVEQAIRRVNFSELLRRMVISVAANGVLVIGVLIALSQLGVSIGPLLAGLGIAGIIIGFALQDTLSNFASGMMILMYRPYDVGDLVEAGGEFGKVTDMSLVYTAILTIDNQRLVVPNKMIWGGVIRNVTAEKIRRVDMTFGIAYDDDIPKAEQVLRDIVVSHDKVLSDPEPMVKLHTLGESSMDFVVRPWVKTEDYWDVYWDVTREVKFRFDAEGISIPFPQRDVHLYGAAGDGQATTMPERASSVELGTT